MTIASEEDLPACALPRGASTVERRRISPGIVLRVPAVVMAAHFD
jgi:hypothetical protein